MPTLQWLTRDNDIRATSAVPYRLLEEVPDLGHGDRDAGNMLIQGNNLDALKALLPFYAGQMKCIYIDPPFNTGEAFDHYDDNLEHSIWLAMMWPRFELIRELLSEEGTLVVHLDDNEMAYAVAVLDEIFGRENRCYLVTFKQGAATGHKSINPGMVNTTNFILIYAKNKASKWKPARVFVERQRDTRYGTFIENHSDSYKEWRFIPLSNAFARHVGKKISALRKELGKEGYEAAIEQFVSDNPDRVIRFARPDADAVGEATRELILKSQHEPNEVFLQKRDNHPDIYLKGGERILFYRAKLREIDGQLVSGEPLTTLWDDLLSNNLHNEGGVSFPKGKKPEALIKRCFELFSKSDDLVLDSFLGSGTSAAVAHKMGRRWIGIEMGEQAVTHCAPRLKRVIDGEQGGISESVNWKGGGGFRFYRLGEPAFDAEGRIRDGIRFPILAAHVWFSETGTPWNGKGKSPLLGLYGERAFALLYNGILGDKTPKGGNVLTRETLAIIREKIAKKQPGFKGALIIYGEASRLSDATLMRKGITFKQTPYEVKARK